MVFHYTTWNSTEGAGHTAPGPSLVFSFGSLGVQLFFVISGFVIFMTLERAPSPRAFAAARIARLYPAFLASMAVTLAVTALLSTEPFYPDRVLASLTMAPHLFGVHAVDDIYWTLLYEMDFYVLAAVCVLVLGWREPELPCAVWVVVSLALRLSGIGRRGTLIEGLTACHFAHLFVIGIMIYRLRHGSRRWPSLAVLAFSLEMTMFDTSWASLPVATPLYAGVIGCFALLVWFAGGTRGYWLAAGPLRALGWMSYPLYLVHRSAGYWVMTTLEAAGLPPDTAIVITACLAIATAGVLSFAAEYRGQRWLRARLLPRPASDPHSG